jgi:dTDP-4-dehydrorhamnose 3,5-epimerase-like enzyme
MLPPEITRLIMKNNTPKGKMEQIKTSLNGCFMVQPSVFKDPRGYFYESFNEQRFNDLSGLNVLFVQDNQSFSTYGVLRGFTFSKESMPRQSLFG